MNAPTGPPRARSRTAASSSPSAHPALPWLDATVMTPSERSVLGHSCGERHRTVLGWPPRRRLALLAIGALVLAGVVAAALRGSSGTGTVSTPFLSYTIPDGWVVDETDATAGEPTALTGDARGPGYDCDGERYVRGFSAAALLPTDGAASSGPADRAERLARWFATSAYSGARGAAPTLGITPPRPVQVVGPRGLVDGTITEVTVAAENGGTCRPARGTVLVLAAPVSGGAAVLLVAGDTEGGPAEPPPPDPAALGGVMESARLLQS